MQSKIQPSESIFVISLLAVTGGFLESYSFICRDQVFANCQTGNLVLFAMYLSRKEFFRAFIYLIPVLAFIAGILLTNRIRDRLSQRFLHWRQMTLVLEIILMFVVGLIPYGSLNTAATTLIAFACSIQVETFRKINGAGCTTTMCTGNLRSAVDFLYHFFKNKDAESLTKSRYYFIIIGTFLLGAVLGSNLTGSFGIPAVWFTLITLTAAFTAMFRRS